VKKPNTKNVLTILIAILIVGGAFLVAEYRNKQAELVYNNISVSTSTIQNYIENTEDWKKILLISDKNGSTTTKDLTKSTEKLTPTDILARDFFARYMELKQIGISNDKLNQQELIENTLGKIVFEKPKLYTMDSIIISQDNSNANVKKYGNDIAYIFNTYATDPRNEAVITKDSIQRNDPNILKELDPIIESYKKITNAILKTSTPLVLSTNHLNLINAMNAGIFINESFRKSAVDPVSGLQAINIYQFSQQNLIDAMQGIANYVKNVGITYTAGEAGILFTPRE
jgi:hypothetical protein